jgi:putative FmdB family regulatory protein
MLSGHYIFLNTCREVTVPIYEYQCTNCGRTLEVMQKITDEPLETCPSCKGKLRRLISLTSFQLKGSGWYATDYKDTGRQGKKKKLSEKPSEKKETQADKKTEKANTA